MEGARPIATSTDSDEAWSDIEHLLHRWFVLYNPLYIVSALLTVVGVYVLGDAMHHGGVPWTQGRLALAATTQVYELTLIAAAAMLTRRGLRRPAVILGLIGAVFAVDACFHTEALAHAEPWDGLAAIAWVVLAGLKLFLWCRVLELRVSASALALIGGAFSLLGVVPWLLDGGLTGSLHVDPSRVLTVVVWIAAVGVVAVRWRRPTITTTWELDAFGEQVARRSETAILALVAGSVALRFGLWAINTRLDMGVELVLPLVWAVLAWAPTEEWAWSVSGALLYLQTQADGIVPPIAVLALVTVLWCARRLDCRGMWTLAVLWGAAAAWGVAPEPLWIGVPTVLVSAAMAWRYRLMSAGLTAGAGLGVGLSRIDLSPTQWGVVLLLGGFVTLGLGVLTNVRWHRRSPPEPAQSADAFGPSGPSDGVTP